MVCAGKHINGRQNVQVVLGIRNRSDEGVEAVKASCSAVPALEQCSTDVKDRSTRTWLMPHQVRNRQEGGKAAKAISSKRSPSGGFANFDLAKAPV